jgi:hypothetical protein
VRQSAHLLARSLLKQIPQARKSLTTHLNFTFLSLAFSKARSAYDRAFCFLKCMQTLVAQCKRNAGPFSKLCDLNNSSARCRVRIGRPDFPNQHKVGGQGWIRTSEGVSQWIYSPPRLATPEPTHKSRRDSENPREPFSLLSPWKNCKWDFQRKPIKSLAQLRGSIRTDLITIRSIGLSLLSAGRVLI